MKPIWWYTYLMKAWAIRRREALAVAIVAHLPNWMIYWSLIRAGVAGIERDEVVPEVPFTTVLQRWPHKGAGR